MLYFRRNARMFRPLIFQASLKHNFVISTSKVERNLTHPPHSYRNGYGVGDYEDLSFLELRRYRL